MSAGALNKNVAQEAQTRLVLRVSRAVVLARRLQVVSGGEDLVHDLRVSLKAAEADLRFLATISSGERRRELKHLRRLCRAVRHVWASSRDAAVMRRLLARIDSAAGGLPPHLTIDELVPEPPVEAKDLKKTLWGCRRVSSGLALMIARGRWADPAEPKARLAFWADLRNVAHKCRQLGRRRSNRPAKSAEDPEWHALRIKVKRVLALCTSTGTGRVMQRLPKGPLQRVVRAGARLAESLGKLHDLSVLSAHLSHRTLPSQQLPQGNRQLLVAVFKKQQRAVQRARRKARRFARAVDRFKLAGFTVLDAAQPLNGKE